MFTRGLNLGPNVESKHHIPNNSIRRSITYFSYVLMILLDCQNKMPDYLINQPFCSDDFIRSWKAGDH